MGLDGSASDEGAASCGALNYTPAHINKYYSSQVIYFLIALKHVIILIAR